MNIPLFANSFRILKGYNKKYILDFAYILEYTEGSDVKEKLIGKFPLMIVDKGTLQLLQSQLNKLFSE